MEEVNACPCGLVHTAEGWQELPLIGTMDGYEEGLQLELRNCACGSTRAIPVRGGT